MPLPNIYIVGPGSTGKTTLISALSRTISSRTSPIPSSIPAPTYISEVARNVMAKHDIQREEIRTSPSRCLALQTSILNAQAEAERAALNGSTEDKAVESGKDSAWFISDRSGVDPIVYAQEHVGVEAAEEMENSASWRELRGRMVKEGALVVLCEPVMEWLEDDGVRLMPESEEDWVRTYRLFRQVLERNGISYLVLGDEVKNIGERVDYVLGKWQALMSETTKEDREDPE